MVRPVPPKRGRGHPTLYDPDLHPDWAEGMRRSGYTMEEVAEAMSVNVDTLREWAKEHHKFSVAIKEGAVESCGRASRVLYRRAMGFDEVEDTTETADGGMRVSRRQLPPDTAALRFFLMNRDRQRWTERRELGGDSRNPIGVIFLPSKREAPS
jgi:transposase-like protein